MITVGMDELGFGFFGLTSLVGGTDEDVWDGEEGHYG